MTNDRLLNMANGPRRTSGAIVGSRTPGRSKDACSYCGRDIGRLSDGAFVWHKDGERVCDGSDRIL